LDQLGIEPLGEGVAPPDPSGVVERIRRHAETLRAQWADAIRAEGSHG
jgi:hypothetical protein